MTKIGYKQSEEFCKKRSEIMKKNNPNKYDMTEERKQRLKMINPHIVCMKK